AIVVAAGPIANFLLAVVLFAVLFLAMGRPVTLPVIGEVLPDSAAQRAGLMANDRIESISGQPIRSFEDIQRIISAGPSESLPMTIQRDDSVKSITVTTDSREANGRRIGQLGIRGGKMTYEPVGVVGAVTGGVTQTWAIVVETLSSVGQMIQGQRGT